MSDFSQADFRYSDIMEEMLDRASRAGVPAEVWRALHEVRLACEGVYGQIEQLAQDKGFCRRHRDAMLSRILNASIARANADMGNIQIFDEGSGRLVIQVHEGFRKPFLDYFGAVDVGKAACGVALQLRKRVIVEDVTNSEIFDRSDPVEVLLDSGVRSVQSTPLIGTRGQLLGVLSTHYAIPRRPTVNELLALDYFAACAGTLIERHNMAGGSSSAVESSASAPEE